jgi:ABC-type oligopeptide transport system ATPase subunit
MEGDLAMMQTMDDEIDIVMNEMDAMEIAATQEIDNNDQDF